ncbi:ExbD/TolR family protein [Bordetella petrii]|uniref:ExbD/TolR family protein n=1 Tax=Bordetella petrii TaxID=94624 RepID=UPI000479DE6F|nr:biopolymer transporter ExbD [Bordetella petrii]
MAFGSFDSKGPGSHAVSEINMVPLIDVMLVLLVIFIITAPLMAHSIRINMPQVSSEQVQEEPKTVDLAIDAAGALFWDEQPVAIEDLPNRFATLAQDKPQPELRIRADLNTRYETLAKVMAAARRSGLSRIGFITAPQPNGAAADTGVPGTGAAASAAAAPAAAAPAAAAPAAGK